MKVQIKITRVATYSKIVEMSEEAFANWNEELDQDEDSAADDLDNEYMLFRDTPDFDDAKLDTFETYLTPANKEGVT